VWRKTDTAYIVESGLVCAEEKKHCLYSGDWSGVCRRKQELPMWLRLDCFVQTLLI
jgi:hypothetical protein